MTVSDLGGGLGGLVRDLHKEFCRAYVYAERAERDRNTGWGDVARMLVIALVLALVNLQATVAVWLLRRLVPR